MNEQERTRADDVAAQIALHELVRLIISEMCFDPDPEVFREKARKVEEFAVNSINGRTHFAAAKPEVETYIKESACGLVTRLMSSIRHPTAP